jgi:hypothetical protein
MLFKKNPRVLHESLEDDKIMISPDGFVAFVINEKDFKLDANKLGGEPTQIMSALIKQRDNAKPAEIVGYIDHPTNKGEVAQIKNDETFTYVDKKYLKYFEKDATFSIVSPKSQVYVYEYENFVGFIMPIHPSVMKEGE